VTIYPMFTFPYSTVGQYCRLKKVKMPNLFQHHQQYNLIAEFFANNGFERASIWSYKKSGTVRYSSATRDGYIGFGAGAGSHVPAGFFINTFSVDEYISRCSSDRFPTALYMPFTDSMHKYFWLYWRLYDTKIGRRELEEKFGRDDKRLKKLLKIVKLLGFIKNNNGAIELNDSGAFWAHLMQNHFILDYINKVWGVAKTEPWPREIVL
jgi:oxygen-independent coproporphyrinogen-3 oxidase